MKKLLLTLVVTLSFGSAIAKSSLTDGYENQAILDMLLLAKPNVEFNLLNSRTNRDGILPTIQSIPPNCTINGNCTTCFGRTFCVEK